MVHLLLALIYLAFISLGLPDALLGAAWPSMYGQLGVPVSYAGVISMWPPLPWPYLASPSAAPSGCFAFGPFPMAWAQAAWTPP